MARTDLEGTLELDRRISHTVQYLQVLTSCSYRGERGIRQV